MSRIAKVTLWIALTLFTIIGAASAVEVDPAIKIPHLSQMAQKAVAQGTIRVIVHLDVPGIASLAEASAQFKVGRSDAAGIMRAASADMALASRITTAADNVMDRIGSSVQVSHRYSAFPLMALEVTSEELDALAQDPQVTKITEDKRRRLFLDNTVDIIGATNAWISGYTGDGWYVAILDNGIRRSHEFFAGKTIVEACYSADSHCPNNGTSQTGIGSAAHHPSSYDPLGWDHGTHVAGIAAGNNGSLFGVARDANIIAIQVFSRYDDPSFCAPDEQCLASWDSDIIAGLNYVYSLRSSYNIAAVNLSLGSPLLKYSSSCDNSSYKTPIDLLRSAGIATVASSGNGASCTGIAEPACVSSAISVGATTDADAMTEWSDYSYSILDLFAPGSAINSSTGDSITSYDSWSGTSMAAPHVAGAFALMREADGVTPVNVLLNILKDTGDPATGSSNCGNNGVTLPVARVQVDEGIDLLLVAPSAPSGLSATAGDSDQIDLSWGDNSGNEMGFKVERKTGAGGTYSEIADLSPNANSYRDNSGLSEATTYYYRVLAYNNVGDSAYTTEAEDTTLVAAPSALAATTASPSQINLAWTDNSAVESGFEIERRNNASNWGALATVPADTESYTDTGLNAGTTYGYRIRSTDGSLYSIYAQSSATTVSVNTGGGGSSGGCFISAVLP